MATTSSKPGNPDHIRRKNQPAVNNEVIEQQLRDLLTPAVFSQANYYRSLGMRARVLTLPVMICAVLMMLWRQVPSVHELARMLGRENLLWNTARNVSQQALSTRFLTFPASIFEQVFRSLLPALRARSLARKRPVPSCITTAKRHFDRIWIVDGSTLEALFRKLDSLRDAAPGVLAGKMCTVVDLITRLPEHIWFTEEALAHDTNFFDQILALSQARVLWLFDRGFYDFKFFDQVIGTGAAFITRIKSNAVYQVVDVLLDTDQVRDRIIRLGGPQKQGEHCLRLIEIRFQKQWYRYLTSVLDPAVLPPEAVVELYRHRWRIEEAFLIVKRLLGLSYLWTGSVNGVLLQVWATWLFYAVLVDLGDAVAEELMVSFDRISLEMVFRGLYHFMQAHSKGKATDPVAYFTAPENRDLGVLKQIRKQSGEKRKSYADPAFDVDAMLKELDDNPELYH